MKNILISSILLSIIMLIAACNPDEPVPSRLDCDNIYPVYESSITDYEPTFEWCANELVDSFRFQLSEVEDFSSLLFDNFTEVNSITPLYWMPHPSFPNSYYNHTLSWGQKHYWRIAKVITDTQEAWSDTYIFETNDIRDDIVGVYEARKRRHWINHNGNPTYYDSVYSIHQIEVEKLPNSRGIRVKDITTGDFDLEMESSGLYHWNGDYEYSHSKFKIDLDSFDIMDTRCSSWPCTGYRYSGRE